MELYRKIDDSGYFIEDVLLEEVPYTYDEEFNIIYDTHYIEIPVPQGMYKPKWDGAEWIEGLTQEEIDNITNKHVELAEIEKIQERQSAIEDVLLFFIDK